MIKVEETRIMISEHKRFHEDMDIVFSYFGKRVICRIKKIHNSYIDADDVISDDFNDCNKFYFENMENLNYVYFD